MRPVCHVVAGPNGAGKSTFALDYLPEFAGSIEYVNPDLMAQGLSPTDITLSSLKAGKLTLKRIRHRVLSGGHDVPTPDVLRRYARSVANLRRYAGLADILRVFDASGQKQTLIYTRHDRANPYSPKMAARMRKDLGI